jgi:hypothetical protein
MVHPQPRESSLIAIRGASGHRPQAELHVATVIATGCGGTCQKGTLFRVFDIGGAKGTTPQVGGPTGQK